MGRYLGNCNCKGVAGENTVIGVRMRTRTRARDHVLAMATSMSPQKNIKKAVVAASMPYDVRELTNRRRVSMMPEENADSSNSSRPETSSTVTDSSSGGVNSEFHAASSSTSNDDSSQSEVVKDRLEIVADPEAESAVTSSKNLGCRSSAWKENQVGALTSDELDSPPRHPNAKSTVQIKMPSDFEIEQFFVEAEKGIHKRFTEKYNFDIVKCIPLEGRYEWVPLKP